MCLTFTFMTFTIQIMNKLAKHMKTLKMKDVDLAREVKCDRSMISKIRREQATPSLKLALAISKKTGVPVESLMPKVSSK